MVLQKNFTHSSIAPVSSLSARACAARLLTVRGSSDVGRLQITRCSSHSGVTGEAKVAFVKNGWSKSSIQVLASWRVRPQRGAECRSPIENVATLSCSPLPSRERGARGGVSSHPSRDTRRCPPRPSSVSSPLKWSLLARPRSTR